MALFVSSAEQLQLVQQQARWARSTPYMYRDPALSARELAPVAQLGSSLEMSDAFLATAARLGKPALAWTADTPADLHRGAQARVNAVVSNRPIPLRAVLMDWRDRCSERQRRQRHAMRRLAGDGPGAAGLQQGEAKKLSQFVNELGSSSHPTHNAFTDLCAQAVPHVHDGKVVPDEPAGRQHRSMLALHNS